MPVTKMPSLPPSVMAAMKEDLAAYRVDQGSGETDMDFQGWLRTQRPQRYRVYLEGMGQGRQEHSAVTLK